MATIGLPAGDTLCNVSLPAFAAILFYWIRLKVVQQLTGLTLGRPNGPACLTSDLLNTPVVKSSEELEDGCVRLHCSTRVVISCLGVSQSWTAVQENSTGLFWCP